MRSWWRTNGVSPVSVTRDDAHGINLHVRTRISGMLLFSGAAAVGPAGGVGAGSGVGGTTGGMGGFFGSSAGRSSSS